MPSASEIPSAALFKLIRELLEKMAAPEHRNHSLAQDRWWGDVREAQDELRRRFAAARGWKPGRQFTLRCLARGTAHDGRRPIVECVNDVLPHELGDHAEFYRTGSRAAGITAHLYDGISLALADRLAQQHGLSWDTPNDFSSWWYPGRTTLILWTRAECGRATQ